MFLSPQCPSRLPGVQAFKEHMMTAHQKGNGAEDDDGEVVIVVRTNSLWKLILFLKVYGKISEAKWVQSSRASTGAEYEISNQNKQGSDLTELRLTWRKMENLNFETFIRIFGEIIEDFGIFFEEFLKKLVHCEKIKNFHQSETNKENEVLRPPWPLNSLGGQT